MDNCDFLSRLIRLTWDNGWELFPLDDNVDKSSLSVQKYDPHDIGDDHIKVSLYDLDGYQLMSCSLERIIFDHDFIRVLCELMIKAEIWNKKVAVSQLTKTILIMLVQESDRPRYLMDTFQELVE